MRKKIRALRVGEELLRLSALLCGLGCYVMLEGVAQGIYIPIPGLLAAMVLSMAGVGLCVASSILEEIEYMLQLELTRRQSLSGLEPRDWRRSA